MATETMALGGMTAIPDSDQNSGGRPFGNSGSNARKSVKAALYAQSKTI